MADKLILPTADMWLRSAILQRIELRRAGVAEMKFDVPPMRERARRAARPGDYPPLRVTPVQELTNQYDVTRTSTERREAWRSLS